MKKLTIRTRASQYPALIGGGLLEQLGAEVVKVLPAGRCALIADATTAALFGDVVLRSLRASGCEATLITVPPGEGAKSLAEVGRVCDEMIAAQLDRTSFVVALGGGVIGDLAGFVAAIYHRGIPHVQVPTTLLAQVDSSIGGKTAVNTRAGKNLLGAVHQPALVLADVETLRTLPPREFRQGFAEIIKHAIIADAALLDSLGQPLEPLVARNVEIKAAIVGRDERDLSGERAILNFGHTVGHAIERAAGYGAILHGEAISLGMVAACEVSLGAAGFSREELERVVAALAACGLPTQLPPDFPREKILPALQSDKKIERGQLRFVVTPRLGSARLTSAVTIAQIEAAIAAL
ncbi:MAG: 3-dehydroquinate synthase [Verrucomicrobiota bacterium]|nr:3-dehydroquinate synthase [Verrucomicrobiota bacterium]